MGEEGRGGGLFWRSERTRFKQLRSQGLLEVNFELSDFVYSRFSRRVRICVLWVWVWVWVLRRVSSGRAATRKPAGPCGSHLTGESRGGCLCSPYMKVGKEG